MSQQKRALIAALVVFAIVIVIAIKTNRPPPSTRQETATATAVATAPASSPPISAEGPPPQSAAQPDKPAEQSAPKPQPQTVAAPATEKPEPSARPDIAKPETGEEVAPREESKPTHLPRLVEIGAEKCIPCRMMQPILAELRQEYAGKLQVDMVDVWKHPEQADKYGIQTIPTQVIYDSSGKEVFRHIGFYPKDEILAKFKELGIDIE